MLSAINTAEYSKSKVWCGPSAIATLTNTPLKATTELLCSVMHSVCYKDLEGCYAEHMIVALGSLGYTTKAVSDFAVRYVDVPYGPTLKRYLRERSLKEKATPLLVEIDGHFLAVHMDWMCDNWVMKPTPLDKCPHMNKLVKRVFFIEHKINY